MPDAQQRADLATRIEQRRQELGARADVSQRLRDLSASGSRFPSPSPRRPRSTLNSFLLTAIAGVGVLIIGAIAALVILSGVWVQSQFSSTPSSVVEDYYAAVHQQDYDTAYSKLTGAAQQGMSETKYEQTMRATDLIDGGVQSYTVVSSSTKGQTATVTVDVVRQGDPKTAQVFQITLTQQGQSWLISSVKQTGQTTAAPASN